ncbi:hypothetical protein GCM10011585_29780 [Edaphobacter dinghuensis]|uniref:Uncharacterized protein n=1 Tax=Edaphobacter dinghuensis TaxID=1560005 RepID=A0A917HND5_9BACT|nr:hypothetical protein GCM10011585_29780 [Edaphobacter dinghuensis]
MHMTAQAHKPRLNPNEQHAESEAGNRAAHTLGIRSNAYIPQTELIPAEEEPGDNEGRHSRYRAQDDLRQLPRKS